MGARPLIGVSTSEVRTADHVHPAPQSEPMRRELALGLAYLEAVDRAGGLPVILSPLDDVDGLLDRLDGLCLSGGPDLHPQAYGAEPHPRLGPTEPRLDLFELTLARHAQMRRMPLLAICRGQQVLNVARGGTLHQHLPDVVGHDVEHRQHEHARHATHPVRVEPNSRLGRLLGGDHVKVNSFHHQAIDRLGTGLRPVAWSSDGVIEGVEARGSGFTVGVQWHAECLADHDPLFRGLVRAAGRRAAAPSLRVAA